MLLRDKRFRYGTFSTVMMLFAIIVFVLANLLAGEFNRTRDLTNEQIFSLSEQSLNFLESLEQDVTITLIARAGQEERITSQLISEYTAASPHIRSETRDPMLNPALIHNFAAQAGIEGGITEHSVVVQSGETVRVVFPHEMIEGMVNPFTGETTITSINIEREITRAIHLATQGEATVLYYVIGSGEMPLPPQFVNFLESENFIVRELNLVLEEIPEHAEILFVPMPARDWTEIKAERMLNFLQAEGNAFFLLDYTPEATPNFADVLDAYGLSISSNLIFEDPQSMFMGRAFYLIPNLIPHEITENLFLQNFTNLLPLFPIEMQINDIRRTTLTFEPLWLTSMNSFSRGLDSEAETLAQIYSDNPGPFPLALAVTDRVFLGGTAYYTQIIAVSSSDFISPHFNAYIGEGNWQFVLNSLRWMQNRAHGIWVPGRVPQGHMPLLITDATANIIGGIAMGGIPLICVAIGAFVWFRRRYS